MEKTFFRTLVILWAPIFCLRVKYFKVGTTAWLQVKCWLEILLCRDRLCYGLLHDPWWFFNGPQTSAARCARSLSPPFPNVLGLNCITSTGTSWCSGNSWQPRRSRWKRIARRPRRARRTWKTGLCITCITYNVTTLRMSVVKGTRVAHWREYSLPTCVARI